MSESSLITVVSGLPRTGTSMMMQMLSAGGCAILADTLRPPDASNAQGYFEFEPVRRLALDSSWLPQARGRAVKVVAPLLRYLPPAAGDGSPLAYRVVFMRREWDEVAASQTRLLENLGLAHTEQPKPELRGGMLHLESLALAWLAENRVPTLEIDYRQTLANPAATADRLASFLPGLATLPAAAAVQQIEGPPSVAWCSESGLSLEFAL